MGYGIMGYGGRWDIGLWDMGYGIMVGCKRKMDALANP